MKLLPLLFTAVVLACSQAEAAPLLRVKGRLNRVLTQDTTGRYEPAGANVSKAIAADFSRLAKKANTEDFAEKIDSAYSEKIRPGRLEKISLASLKDRTGVFAEEVRHAVELRRGMNAAYRQDPALRLRMENVLVGALHVIDTELRSELNVDTDELWKLRRYLLSQGTFISNDASSKLTMNDLWWDWMWVRGYSYPADLVELHLQKVERIAKGLGPKKRAELNKYVVSMTIFALKKATPVVLDREKIAAVDLRLVQHALEKVGTTDTAAEKILKLHLYRLLQLNGETYEASQLKKEIAMDLFLSKGKTIILSPAEPWKRQDLSFFSKVSTSIERLFRGVFSAITYGIGFIFIATPIELILILTALTILSKQGQSFYSERIHGIPALARLHRIYRRDGWRRLPTFLRSIAQNLVHEGKLAWRMFVASYTSASVPFYSKVATSLLIFGVGLYFNSARNLVEAVVNQVTM